LIKPSLLTRKDSRRRFQIEAQAATQIDSPHAVRVFDYGETDDGVPFMVMEFLEGESLADCVSRRGAFSLEELARILSQASKAISKAHAQGIFHRDLKPDNVFLATNVEHVDPELPYTVKIVDFGIAKLLDNSFQVGGGGAGMAGPTQTGMVVGTPSFMSPEQLTEGGEPDALTDVWTLGVTFFTAATATLPFEGEVLGDVVLKVCVSEMPKPSRSHPELPSSFDEWFAKACARDRKKRFQTVTEMSDALSLLAEGGRDTARRLPTPQALLASRRSRPDPQSNPPASIGSDPPPGQSEERIRAQAPTGDVSYRLRAVERVTDSVIPPAQQHGFSRRMAIMVGLVLGVSFTVGTVGFLAWQNSRNEPPPAEVATPSPEPAPVVSAAASAAPAPSSSADKLDAGAPKGKRHGHR
jgi:serine/threonine-protein kinase